MKQSGRFVKRTCSDAVGAIGSICRPEGKACLGIDRPPKQALPVGYIIRFIRRLAKHNGFAGTFTGALFTYHAEVPNPELNRLIRN